MGRSARKTIDGGAGIPWVTYALLLAFVIVFQLVRAQESRNQDVAWGELTQAKDYLRAHPLLETPPILEAEVGEAVENLRRRELRARESRGAPPIPAGVLRRQQAELDQMVAEATERFAKSPVHRWGVRLSERDHVTWLTHAFLHTGWVHLVASGCLFLLLGFYLELAWGSVLFAFFAAGTTFAAAGFMTTLRPDLEATLVGPTGLLTALLGAFVLRMSSLAGTPPYWFVLLLGSLFVGLPTWLGLELAVADGADGTLATAMAPGASLLFAGVGLAVGFVLALGIRISQFEEAFVTPRRDARLTQASNPTLDRALAAQAKGRMDEAYRLLRDAMAADESDRDAALAMWDLATVMGRPADAAAAMLRVIRDDVRRGDDHAARDHWLELEDRGLSADADMTLLIRMAQILRRCEQPYAAVVALKRALELGGDAVSPVVASRVARAARDLDAATAETAAWQALGSLELGYEERQALEEMLGELHATGDLALEIEAPRRHDHGRADPREIRLPEPEEAGDAEEPERPTPIDLDLAGRALQAEDVTPVGFEGQKLVVERADGTKMAVELRKVDAVAVAAVHGLGPKPVILIDLVFNWVSLRDEPLEVLRMRADRFDPRRLSPERSSPLDALRDFLAALDERTSATSLPDRDAALGRPLAILEDLATYHRDVLMVAEEAGA